MSVLKLNKNQTLKCEGAITECELSKALNSMDNDKSPGNDDITKEFIKFLDVVKEPLYASIQQSFILRWIKYISKTGYYKINWEKK